MGDDLLFRPIHLISYLSRLALATNDFYKSYKILSSQETERETGGAAIVCLAFSIELHFKFLQCVQNAKHLKTHRISELFSSLSRSLQEQISVNTIARWSSSSPFGFSFPESSFTENISALDNSFLHWRYVQEKLDQNGKLVMPSGFAVALIEAVKLLQSVIVRSPDELSDNDLRIFSELVMAGRRLDELTIPWLRSHGASLIFLYTEGQLVGVSGVKKPDENYRTKVFAKAKSPRNPGLYKREIGYVAVRESLKRRGYGRKVSELALNLVDGQSVYATTHEENTGMRKILIEAGFQLEGNAYKNSKGEVLLLFIRNA